MRPLDPSRHGLTGPERWPTRSFGMKNPVPDRGGADQVPRRTNLAPAAEDPAQVRPRRIEHQRRLADLRVAVRAYELPAPENGL